MSRVSSPSGRSPSSYGAISPTALNIKAARRSISPPHSEFTMKGVADQPKPSINEDSSGEEDDNNFTCEVTPLVTSPENGASKVKRRGKGHNALDLPDSVRCDCHEQPKPADKASRNRLIIACIVVLLFMIGEIIGLLRLQRELTLKYLCME